MLRKIIVLLTLTVLISGVAGAQDDQDYRVGWADTLDLIGQEFDVSVACLVEANSLNDANVLRFAQMLVIPSDCLPYDSIESDIVANQGPLTVIDTASDQGGGAGIPGEHYRAGWADTLDVIGQEYNVSVACLAGANGLINANVLAYAQIIVIPDDCEPYDPIESDIIANIEDLSKIGLTESELGRGGGGGQSLLEPGSEPETTMDMDADDSDADEDAMDAGGSTSSSTQTAQPSVMPNETYIIQWGDNLTRIAARFNASASCLQQVNGIFDPDTIYAGNQILVTAQCRLSA